VRGNAASSTVTLAVSSGARSGSVVVPGPDLAPSKDELRRSFGSDATEAPTLYDPRGIRRSTSQSSRCSPARRGGRLAPSGGNAATPRRLTSEFPCAGYPSPPTRNSAPGRQSG
jgi:hypothetical protein